ncbi:MAG: response regulator [Desulfamplus sp.]|nr:response regulator [Desulfamplus sp.]
MYIDLLLNLSFLVAITIVSGFIDKRWSRNSLQGAILQGLLFGLASLLGMLRPLNFGDGVIFDGRSVMLSLCSLFFGPLAAGVSSVVPIAYRIQLGGSGAAMGVLSVLSSITVGLLARKLLIPDENPPSSEKLYLFGVVVHLAMLTMTLALPAEIRLKVLNNIALPIMLLYPLATVLAGKILSDQVLAIRAVADVEYAQKSLKTNESKYRNLFENAPIGIFTTSSKGHALAINTVMANIVGFSSPAEATKHYSELAKNLYVNPSDREKFLNELKDKGSVKNFEYQARRADGKIIWLTMNARIAQQDSDGHFIIEGFTTEITEQKKLEAQFRQAQKMESVGRLAGGVAHDFNNMLGVIIGYTELALDSVQPEEPLHNDLLAILKAAERSAQVTRQLLAFARKQTISPKVIDLNQTVEGLLNMLHRLIGEDIKLSWLPKNAQDGNLSVLMDPSQIDQILVNLCVNAKDAIGGVGNITIETGVVTFDEAYCEDHAGFLPGEFVLLAVSDNGCGIDKKSMAKLFEPFFTTKAVGEGTGLGLATVYGIIKQNRGFINVYSEPNKGSTFKIYLQRYKTDIDSKRDQNHLDNQQSQSTKIAKTVSNETILIVEDEPSILDMATLMLKRLGYSVLGANSTKEAIRLAESHSDNINLLMTDVVMPEMDGRQLAKRLSQLNPNLRVLFMSGYTANVIAHHGVLDKGVNFIQKPFSMQELAQKLKESLE